MIYAGVDIAKDDHVIDAIDDSGDEVCKPLSFNNSEAGFERCAAWLEGVAEGPEGVIIAMEATGHYWMACYSFLVSQRLHGRCCEPGAREGGSQAQEPLRC